MDKKTYGKLLKTVYENYPVGSDVDFDFARIRTIIEKKVNGIINENYGSDRVLIDWNRLIMVVDKKISTSTKLEDLSYLQFPALSLKVDDTRKSDNFVISRSFCLHHSLLTNHYTYYLQHEIKFCDTAEDDIKSLIPMSIIRYNSDKKFKSLWLDNNADLILECYKEIFSRSMHIDYYALEMNKVNSVLPYGSFISSSKYKSTSFFKLLFDSREYDYMHISH